MKNKVFYARLKIPDTKAQRDTRYQILRCSEKTGKDGIRRATYNRTFGPGKNTMILSLEEAEEFAV